ncbi:hypothetical protein HY041_02415, partial [Candidatus Roizmanbacteria bacterium]|nr:hypothetical protein [Candidatus Roizmanbacteria bacterium]
YYKFAFFTVVAYAVLLSFTTIYLYQYLKNRFQKHSFFVFIIPLIICLYGWPFFVGIVPKQDYLTSIPNDYKELRNSLSSDVTDSKVLALPPAPKGSGLLLQWNNGDKYAGPHPDAYLIDKPVIDSYWFTRVGYKDLIADDSWTGKKFEDNFAETLRYLGILNIRYLFVHNDFVENYDFGNKDVRKIEGRLKAKRLESLISKYPDIIVMKQTPYFMLYKLPDRLFLPHFYIPETLIYSTDQIRELFNSEQKMGKYAILPSKQINNKTDFDKDNSPTIRFTRVNPTKYKVRIKQAIKPFYLIFSESFDNNWKLYINNSNLDDTIKDSKHLSALFNQNIFETWGKTPINDKNHMKANGYANAWFIQPDNRQNNHEYEVIVEYKPQQYFYLGLIISIITLIGSSVYIFYHILKKENV